MSVINFTLTKPLEQKVNQVIKKEGFTSKAEFFRFAALNYIQNLRGTDISQEEFEGTVRALKNTIRKVYKNKKIPSLREQLSDI